MTTEEALAEMTKRMLELEKQVKYQNEILDKAKGFFINIGGFMNDYQEKLSKRTFEKLYRLYAVIKGRE